MAAGMASEWLQLRLEGIGDVSVVAAVVREGLSQRTQARLEVASTTPLDLGDTLAEPLRLFVAGSQERWWTLVLGAARFAGDRDGSFRYLLDLYDAAWLLRFAKNTRKFRKQSAQQIVSKVLDECGVDHRWQLTGTPAVRNYCAQYRETNLAFVERLLEFEGIYYRFESDGTMVLGDDSRASEALSDDPFELIEAAGAMDRGELGVHVLKKVARLEPGAVTLADYNWKTPKVLLRATALGDSHGDLEVYDYPAGFRKPDQGESLAQRRIEALRVPARQIHGRGNVLAFAPERSLTLASSCGEMFEGERLILEVEHAFVAGDIEPVALEADTFELAAGAGYENRFALLARDQPFRPPLETPRPRVGGTHTAMVRGPGGSEIHTDKYGRFRAQMHWDREATGTDADSRWVRKLQESATSMGLARNGWEMFLHYIDGDPERPIGVARAINGVMPPEYGLPASKNLMSIKTPSSPASGGYNEIKMDDSAGAQQIAVRAEKDLDQLVKNDRSESVGHDEQHEVGVDLARQVSGSQNITVGGNSDASFGEDHDITIGGDRSKSVAASERITVGGGKRDRIGGDDDETVGGVRLTIAGSLSPPDIGAMAKSAAQTFTRQLSPGATGLMNQAQSLGSQVQGLASGESLQGAAQGALQGAGQSAIDAAREGGGAGGAAEAAGGSLQGSLGNLLPTQESPQGQLQTMRGNLNSLVPTQESFAGALQGGASTLTGGLSDSLSKGDYGLALNQAIDMFGVGGIRRSVEGTLLKLVGGVYLTVAVGHIDWTVGSGYAETVGGLKLTGVLGSYTTNVDQKQITTVGGAALRGAVDDLTVDSEVSTVTAGSATYAAFQQLLMQGATVVVAAGGSLKLKAGEGTITMSPNSVKLEGEVKLSAATELVIDGDAVELTP
jgi:type VI secretion system secreted protein VgrG